MKHLDCSGTIPALRGFKVVLKEKLNTFCMESYIAPNTGKTTVKSYSTILWESIQVKEAFNTF